jgi:hypothetical protein
MIIHGIAVCCNLNISKEERLHPYKRLFPGGKDQKSCEKHTAIGREKQRFLQQIHDRFTEDLQHPKFLHEGGMNKNNEYA